MNKPTAAPTDNQTVIAAPPATMPKPTLLNLREVHPARTFPAALLAATDGWFRP
jgi:hypothetical protein